MQGVDANWLIYKISNSHCYYIFSTLDICAQLVVVIVLQIMGFQ